MLCKNENFTETYEISEFVIKPTYLNKLSKEMISQKRTHKKLEALALHYNVFIQIKRDGQDFILHIYSILGYYIERAARGPPAAGLSPKKPGHRFHLKF